MKGRAIPSAELMEKEKVAMYALLQSNFSGVTLSQFESDLAEKNWVILLESDGQIQGFSTILKYTESHQGVQCNVIYSGDTIIDKQAWGSFGLHKTWIATVNELCGSDEKIKTYWLLITSGFRTYRFLPVFWKHFYPHFDSDSPKFIRSLVRKIARNKFGESYCEKSGIVRFSKPQPLREELLAVPEGRLKDPHVQHFLKLNPGYVQGDELVCLTELSINNLTKAGARMVRASKSTL